MADAFAANDVARLDFNGADAGTTFTDTCSAPHTFTGGTGATTSTVNKKYGTASLLLTGASTAYISSVTSADWNMGSGDFCHDTWFFPTTLTNVASTIASIEGGGVMHINMQALANGGVSAQIVVGGVTKTLLSATGILLVNRWYHIALVRSGVNAYLYLNGSVVASDATLSTTAVDFSSDTLNIGGSPISTVSSAFVGRIDQHRVTKGQARYTTPFNLPIDNFNAISSAMTTVTLGPNTKQVTATNETNWESQHAAVTAAIVALGWTVYDYQHRNGNSLMIYRCLNKDGTSYKYAFLNFDRSNMMIHLGCCESWDLSTKAMVNEAYQGVRNNRMGINLTNCDIVIFGNARYLGIQTYLINSPSESNFVFEFEREAAEDTAAAGVPCWGSWNSTMQGPVNAVNYCYGMLMVPRTKDGRTGTAANKYQTVVSAIGAWGSMGGSQAPSVYLIANMARHGWDNTKKLVTTFKLIDNDNAGQTTVHGRIFGWKMVPPLGNPMDTVTFPVDSDGFFSAGGTNTTHYLLDAQNGLYQNRAAMGGFSPTSSSYATSSNTTPSAMCFTGQFIYVTGATGLFKCDVVGGTFSQVQSGTITGVTHDVCFDGRYVYVTTTTGVARVEVQNSDAVTTLTLGTGGLSSICYDGNGRLYASQRTASTTPSIYAIDTGSFTQVGSTMTMAAGRVTAAIVKSLVSDGQNQITGVYCNTTTAADCNFAAVSMSNYSTTWYSLSPTIPNALTNDCIGVTFLGGLYLINSVGTGGAGTIYGAAIVVNSSGLTQRPLSTALIQATTAQVNYGRYTGWHTAMQSGFWYHNTVNVGSNNLIYSMQEYGWVAYETGTQVATVTAYNTNFGDIAPGISPKIGLYTGNSFFTITSDNVLHQMRNNLKGITNSGTAIAQFAILK